LTLIFITKLHSCNYKVKKIKPKIFIKKAKKFIFITKSQCCKYKVNKIKPKKFIKKAKKALFFIDLHFHNKIPVLQSQRKSLKKPKKYLTLIFLTKLHCCHYKVNKVKPKKFIKKANLQIDGEPWEQHQIDIYFHGKIPVLQLQSQ
jgi:hypothetical protein